MRTIIPAALVAVAGLGPGCCWPAGAQTRDAQGAYTLDAAASDNIETAIERGTAEMNFAIRPLARTLIAKTNPVYPHIALTRKETSLRVQFDPHQPAEIPLDGSTVPWEREDGGRYQVGARWSDTQLEMHFAAADGERVNTLVLDPDGTTLRFKVRLKSPRLPAPITYVLVYRRQDS